MYLLRYASGNRAVPPAVIGSPNASLVSAVTVRISRGSKTAPLASVCGYCQNPLVGSGGVVKVQCVMGGLGGPAPLVIGDLVNSTFFSLYEFIMTMRLITSSQPLSFVFQPSCPHVPSQASRRPISQGHQDESSVEKKLKYSKRAKLCCCIPSFSCISLIMVHCGAVHPQYVVATRGLGNSLCGGRGLGSGVGFGAATSIPGFGKGFIVVGLRVTQVLVAVATEELLRRGCAVGTSSAAPASLRCSSSKLKLFKTLR